MNGTADQHRPIRGTETVVVETFLCVVIDVLALCGNTFVCLAVLRNARLRSATSMFIVALSVSDIMTALLCVPITAALLVDDGWIPNSFLCKLQGYALHNFSMISVVTMALTAVNRFVRVKKPARYGQLFTKRKSIFLLAAAWLAVILFYVGVLASGSTSVRYEADYSTCAIAHVMPLIVFESMTISLSLLVITLSYFKVFDTIRQHQASVAASLAATSNLGASATITVEEIKISKVLFATVLGFGLCWVPSMLIITLDRTVDGPLNPTRRVTLLGTFLAFLSCAINPVIYGVMNRAFRAEYKRIILCRERAQGVTKFRKRVRLLMWANEDRRVRPSVRRPQVQLDDISAPDTITQLP